MTDAKKHAFDRIERPPSAGASLELTIDSVLQHVVERELQAGIAENRADGGTAIVMDPRTGEILAMANEPTFNPNNVRTGRSGRRAATAPSQDVYEPGSTFKIGHRVGRAREGVLTPDTLIDCARRLHPTSAAPIMHDTHPTTA